MNLLRYIKHWIEKSGQAENVHQTLFQLSEIRNKNANSKFRKAFPNIAFPPNSLLFETGSLHYGNYIQSGKEAAAELHSLCTLFHPEPIESIVDWGCGTGRVTRHLHHYFPEARITGIDANPACIEWLQHNIPDIDWQLGSYQLQNKLPAYSVDLIIALSVLTHLPAADQPQWMQQLHKQLHTNGLIWLSTHGSKYDYQLTGAQRAQLLEKGILTLGAEQTGSRAMRTYHTYKGMQQLIQKDWQLILYYNGAKFPGVLGGQDAWLLKKLG
ncbi:MAG: class I SAM-dependent methyltransferase [Sediminibacterium sp.]|nr:class I SAM-dependent methyltransferase [Sediminibacterium sp.]